MTHSARLPMADEQLLNSLSGLCASVANAGTPFGGFGIGDQLSMADTLFLNNRWYLISNLRQLLTQLYVEHGIVQTLCEQPVLDSWRAGYEIKTGMLNADEIEELVVADEELQVTAAYIQSRIWARLYGGGGVLIVTDQDPATPLNIETINEKTPLEFRDCDMWELYYNQQNVQANMDVGGQLGENLGEFYDYYGIKVHKSRVLIMRGKKCPSFLRPRLRGWGMSELERLVRSLNQYMKNQDVIFSLLDEAKVDVYGIKGFNNSLLTAEGTSGTSRRIQMANQIKSFNNALVMDSTDTYEQKQIAFTGLSDVLLQIRQGVAADLKFPMTKLFGISAAGFNSGEDDIENYNSMCESEIRKPDKYLIVKLLRVLGRKKFGVTLSDLQIIPKPLRILNAKEEEEVKDSRFNRIMASFQSALIDDKTAREGINKDSLLPVECDVNASVTPPLNAGGADAFAVGGAAKGGVGKKSPEQE
jgi:phage-related protein (TIGR01555 family)